MFYYFYYIFLVFWILQVATGFTFWLIKGREFGSQRNTLGIVFIFFFIFQYIFIYTFYVDKKADERRLLEKAGSVLTNFTFYNRENYLNKKSYYLINNKNLNEFFLKKIKDLNNTKTFTIDDIENMEVFLFPNLNCQKNTKYVLGYLYFLKEDKIKLFGKFLGNASYEVKNIDQYFYITWKEKYIAKNVFTKDEYNSYVKDNDYLRNNVLKIEKLNINNLNKFKNYFFDKYNAIPLKFSCVYK